MEVGLSVKGEMERIANMIQFLRTMPNPTETTPNLIDFYEQKLGELMRQSEEFQPYLDQHGRWVLNRQGETEDDI